MRLDDERQSENVEDRRGGKSYRKPTLVLFTGAVEEALRAATAIGDDRLQKQSRGFVVPDSFTHGTSEQRVRWFRRGIETGDINQCNTFKASNL